MPVNIPTDPQAKILAQVAAPGVVGGYDFGPFTLSNGDLAITSFCTGGTLTIQIDPVASFSIPCDAVPTPTRNVFTVSESRNVIVRVSAGEGARWNLLVDFRSATPSATPGR
jgi:hypothetical protein